MRQRIDPGNRQGEVRVVLVGDPQSQGLDAKLELRRIAVEGLLFRGTFQVGELGWRKDWLVYLPGRHPVANQLDRAAHRDHPDDLHGFREHGSAHDDVWFQILRIH